MGGKRVAQYMRCYFTGIKPRRQGNLPDQQEKALPGDMARRTAPRNTPKGMKLRAARKPSGKEIKA